MNHLKMTQQQAAQRRRDIAARMREPGASIADAAKDFGVNEALVYRSCREHKVALTCRPTQKARRQQIEQMLREGASVREVSDTLKCSVKLVYLVAKGCGLGVRAPRMSLVKIMYALRELMLDGKSMVEIGRLIGHSDKAVHRVYQAALAVGVPGLARKVQGERYGGR